MLIPNALSMRRAISPDRPAFWFKRFDSAGRDTPSTFAAAVTDSPCVSTTSVLMKSPGVNGEDAPEALQAKRRTEGPRQILWDLLLGLEEVMQLPSSRRSLRRLRARDPADWPFLKAAS